MKKIILSLILGIFLLNLVYAYPVQIILNGNMNFNSTIYHCQNSQCSSLDSSSYYNLFGNPISYSIGNFGTGTQYFAEYDYVQDRCYVPHSYINSFTTSTSNGPWSYDITLNKRQCTTAINSYNYKTSMYDNETQIINVNASSPLTNPVGGPVFIPSYLENFYSGNVKTIVEIKDSTNNIVYSSTQNQDILSSKTKVFTFNVAGLDAGTYNLNTKVYSDDCFCSSHIITERNNSFVVNNSTSYTPTSTTTNVIVNPSSPITYTTLSNFSCSNSAGQNTVMKINGVDKTSEKGLNVLRAAGNYIVNCSFAGNSNYQASSQQITYVINKMSPPNVNFNLTLNANPAWLVNSGTQTTITGAGCPSQLVCTLTRNSASVSNPNIATLAVGLYNYVYSTLGNENYSSASLSNVLNVTSSSIDITPPTIIVYSPQNINYTNATILINFTATDNVAVDSLWYNNGTRNISYTNPIYVNLANGSYTFTFYANDTSGNMNSVIVNFNVNTSSNVLQCHVNSDCGVVTSSLICMGNNVTNATITPLCISNTCQSSTSYVFIKKCTYGCSNGKCNSCNDNNDNGNNQAEEKAVCGNNICENWLGENEFNCEEDCFTATPPLNYVYNTSVQNLGGSNNNSNLNIGMNIILFALILLILLLLIFVLILRNRKR